MKKFLLGLFVGLVLFMPAVTFADEWWPYDGLRGAKDIYQFNCEDSFSTSKCNHVAVFDDQDNKCYVSYDSRGTQSSISCVKR